MPTQDKPSKFITQLTAKLKQSSAQLAASDREISGLKSDLTVALEANNAAQVQLTARDKLLGQAAVEREVQLNQVRDSLDLVRQVNAQRDSLITEGHEVAFKLAAAESTISDLELQLSDAARKIAEMSVRSADLDQKEADIRAMVDRVEARMRRDERQNASAILNRKAMAGAIPGANRR